MKKQAAVLVFVGMCCVTLAGSGAWAEPTCDTLYYQLQDLSLNHIRANEVWVEYFLECPPVDGAFGGFVLSDLTQEGARDRSLVATYHHGQWRYQFGERGPNIRFAPEPHVDIDRDGIRDFVFIAEDTRHRPERSVRLVFLDEESRRRSVGGLGLATGIVIDSIVPAPDGQPHDLIAADRRGWDMGGLSWDTAPVSYQYLVLDDRSDPPAYINHTAQHADEFPIFAERKKYIEQLGEGRLEFDTEKKYETFLINVIGHSLDLDNMGRGLEAYELASDILERARFMATTVNLRPPRTVQSQLKRVLPRADEESKGNQR